MIVSEILNTFCPLPREKLFLHVKENREEIDKIIEKINSFITQYSQTDSKKVGSVAGAAILAGVESIRDMGGRVMVFTCNQCINGYGACKPRDDQKFYGSEHEKNLYNPQHNTFVKLAEELTDKRIAVDLFVLGNTQFDLATFSPISNNTGGSVFFYNIDNNNPNDLKYKLEKMHYNLSRILTRENYYDVKFMLRYSLGFEVMEILGPFTRRLGEGLFMPSCDPDLCFSYMLRLSENLKPDTRYHFQLVALYIDNYNQRYLRVFNYTLLTTNDISI
jgi:hypothetical protein